MRFSIALPATLGVLLLGACNDLTVGDLNAPGVDQTQNSPTRAGVLSLATGLQIGGRFGMGNQNGYVALLGITGEEIYNFDPADPRFITEMVFGPLDGGSPAFGGNLFAQVYANIRTANIMLHAMGGLSDTPPAGMSPAEKEATLAYAQTMMAYDLLRALNTRWDNGIPIDVDIDPTGPPAAIVDTATAFTHIYNLLDSAATHLTTRGRCAVPVPDERRIRRVRPDAHVPHVQPGAAGAGVRLPERLRRARSPLSRASFLNTERAADAGRVPHVLGRPRRLDEQPVRPAVARAGGVPVAGNRRAAADRRRHARCTVRGQDHAAARPRTRARASAPTARSTCTRARRIRCRSSGTRS